MYTQSKTFLNCHVAGFAHWDGTKVASKLAVGDRVTLQAEPDNPHDPCAVALYYKKHKIGFIPQGRNVEISQLLYFGHNIFEARISQLDLTASPERQLRINIQVVDARES